MNTTILTENHPQSSGGHRTESSLNMPPKSWKDYVPRYVSLYYVDYNENLDNHEDLQERCIRRNSLHPLEEQVWEWYAEQEHDNLQEYLADIRKVLIYISTLENHRKAGVGKSPNQSFLFI